MSTDAPDGYTPKMRPVEYVNKGGARMTATVELPDWVLTWANRAADEDGREFAIEVFLTGFCAGIEAQMSEHRLGVLELTEGLAPDVVE